jgi:hypothetical protein
VSGEITNSDNSRATKTRLAFAQGSSPFFSAEHPQVAEAKDNSGQSQGDRQTTHQQKLMLVKSITAANDN